MRSKRFARPLFGNRRSANTVGDSLFIVLIFLEGVPFLESVVS